MTDLKKLLDEASPQPWFYPDDGGHLIYGQRGLSGVAGVFPGSRADPKPSRANARLIVAAVNAVPELLALREEVGRLREALRLGKVVMDLLDEHGPSIVPHLLDTDENAGQRFRAALNQEPGQ